MYMSKKAQLKEVAVDEVKPSLTKVALGVYKDEATGEWMVAKLFFDPETGEAELAEKIAAGPGRDFAIEKFKIVAVQERIVG